MPVTRGWYRGDCDGLCELRLLPALEVMSVIVRSHPVSDSLAKVVVVTFSSHVRLYGGRFDESFPVCTFFLL